MRRPRFALSADGAGVGEFHAVAAQAVDVRGFVESAAITARIGSAEVVHQNKDQAAGLRAFALHSGTPLQAASPAAAAARNDRRFIVLLRAWRGVEES